MKTINVTFTDEEYESINKNKEALGLSWHDFIYVSCGGEIKAHFEYVTKTGIIQGIGKRIRKLGDQKEKKP